MTVLSKEALEARLDEVDPDRRLVITPMLDRSKQVNSASIDLRLGTDFLVGRRRDQAGIDPGDDEAQMDVDKSQERVVLPLGQSLWLHPQELMLGSTLEFVRVPPDCAAYVLGRSSWGRIGLLVATAVTVQPGFPGSLTLELVNEGNTPIRLWPALRVAQLVVHTLDRVTQFPYKERFVRAIGPEPAKLGWDRPEVERVRAVSRQLEGSPASDGAVEASASAEPAAPGAILGPATRLQPPAPRG